MSRHSRIGAGFPLHVRLNRSGTTPLWNQLFRAVSREIQRRRLVPGDGLPSVRNWAQSLGVSPDTVVRAYDELRASGYIEARPRSGYVVSSIGSVVSDPTASGKETTAATVVSNTDQNRTSSNFIALNPRARYAEAVYRRNWIRTTGNRPFVPYASVLPVVPDRVWMKIAGNEIKAPWRQAYYSPPQGVPALRKAIAERLSRRHGVFVAPERIIVTTGMVQGLALCANLLFTSGDVLWLEGPSTDSFAEVFPFWGLSSQFVPVDENGMNVPLARARWPEARGAFVTPASQMPMSVPLSDERKEELVAWARSSHAFLLEDGTPDLLSLDGVYRRPIFTLPGAQEVTVYLSSFSLAFFPDIKIAYLVVPESLVDAFAGAKLLFDRNTSGRNQEILARFLCTDDYETYVRKITRHYRTNHRCLCEAATRHLSPFGTLSPTTNGPHVAFRFSVPLSDRIVSERLEEKGITARPLSRFCGAGSEHRGLLLGFGGFTAAEIEAGVAAIAEGCAES